MIDYYECEFIETVEVGRKKGNYNKEDQQSYISDDGCVILPPSDTISITVIGKGALPFHIRAGLIETTGCDQD